MQPTIDKNWQLLYQPSKNNYVAFNPTNLNQRIAYTQDELTPEIQSLKQADSQTLYNDIFTKGPGAYGYGSPGQTWSEMGINEAGQLGGLFGDTLTTGGYAEQQRLADLTKQIQAGTLSAEQGTTMANDPALNLANPPKVQDQSSPKSSKLSPSIQSHIITTPDGKQHTVEIGSEAEARYMSMGGTVSEGGQTQGGAQGSQPQAGTQAPTAYFSGANLAQGSRGPAVQQLQQALGITADGIFGPQTLAAVKSYQLSKGLKADGIVGPQTMAALNAPSGNPAQSVAIGIQKGSETAAKQAAGVVDQPVSSGNPLIDSLMKQLKDASPQTSFSKVYKQIYQDMGLDTFKKDYQTQVNAYSDLQNKKNDEIQDINNNPWYSEGVRVQKLAQLDKKYEGKELILQNKIKLLETNIDNGRQDAQFIAGQTMIQLNKAAELNQEIIIKAIEIAENQIESEYELLKDQLNQSPSDIYGSGAIGEYNFARSQGYSGSFSDYQNEDANRKAKASGSGLLGGLTAAQINATVNQIVGTFDNEPIVKEYNTIARNVDTFNNLGNSATDDIQRVYTFAKVADPNSAVKEGEYNSIEKYAQAVLQRAGLRVSRVFTPTGILTPEARTAMGRTLQTSLNSSKKTFDNVKSSYDQRIADVRAGLGNSITDYSAAYNSPTPTPSKFDYLQKDIQIQGNVAYLPRSIWNTVKGADKDALLAEAKNDGYQLLILD